MSGDEGITTLILSVSLRQDGDDAAPTPLLYALSETADEYGVLELHVLGIRQGEAMVFLPYDEDELDDSGLDDDEAGRVADGSEGTG